MSQGTQPNIESLEQTTAQLLIEMPGLKDLVSDKELADMTPLERFNVAFSDLYEEVDALAMLGQNPAITGLWGQETLDSFGLIDETPYRSSLFSPLLSETTRSQLIDNVARHATQLASLYSDSEHLGTLIKIEDSMSGEEKVIAKSHNRPIEAKMKLLEKTGLFLEAYVSYEITTGDNPHQTSINTFLDITQEEREQGEQNPVRPNLSKIIEEVAKKLRPNIAQELVEKIRSYTKLNPYSMQAILKERAIDPTEEIIIATVLERWYQNESVLEAKLNEAKAMVNALKKVGASVDLLYQLQELPTGQELERQLTKKKDEQIPDLIAVIGHFTGLTPEKLWSFQPTQTELIQFSRRRALEQDLIRNPLTEPVETVEEAIKRARMIIEEVIREMPVTGVGGDQVYFAGQTSIGRDLNTSLHVQSKGGEVRQVQSMLIQPQFVSGDRLKSTIVHELTHNVRAGIGEALRRLGKVHSASIIQPQEEVFAAVAQTLSNVETEHEPQGLAIITPYPGELKDERWKPTLGEALKYFRQAPHGKAIYSVLRLIEDFPDMDIHEANFVINSIYESWYDGTGISPGRRSLATESMIVMDGLRYVIHGEDSGGGRLAPAISEILRKRAKKMKIEGAPLSDRRIRAIFYSLMHYIHEAPSEYGEWLKYLKTCTLKDAYSRLAEVGISKENV